MTYRPVSSTPPRGGDGAAWQRSARSEWQHGLIVARGNPKGISHAAELARPDLTVVNRELGAGSLALLDLWLQATGVMPTRVNGYGHEVSSHLEVADAVARGRADDGPGIMAVARVLGLDFLSLQEER